MCKLLPDFSDSIGEPASKRCQSFHRERVFAPQRPYDREVEVCEVEAAVLLRQPPGEHPLDDREGRAEITLCFVNRHELGAGMASVFRVASRFEDPLELALGVVEVAGELVIET